MEVKPGYKETEVGVIPEDWDVVELRSICSMKSGEGITSANIDQFSRFPCYGGNGLRGFTNRFTHDGSYALIGRQGALCGNVLGVEGRFFASEHAVVVTAFQQTDIRWLTYVLGEMRLNRFSESSAQPGLSVSKVLMLRLASPPDKGEQGAIAEALSDVDALLGGLDQLIAKKHDLKQATMQRLLTGRTRLPGFHGKWGVKRSGEIAQLRNGYAFKSETYSPVGDFKIITIANVQDGYMVTTECSRIVAIPRDVQPHQKLKLQDILISMTGNVGRVCRVNETNCLLNQRVGKFEPKDIDVGFLFMLLSQRRFLVAMEAKAKGGAQGNLSVLDITDFQFVIPPTLDEQSAIATVLTDMDAELVALEQRRKKTRDLKLAMTQELLTGKTRLV